MLRSKRGLCLLTVAAVLLAAGTDARAVDASDILVYNVGPFRLKPHVGVSEQYNDNIFFRSDKPTFTLVPVPGLTNVFQVKKVSVEDDLITTLSAGTALQLGRREANHVMVDYTMDKSWYLDHQDVGHLDHTLLANTLLQGNRLTLTGNDRVQFLSGILGGGQNLGTKVNRWSFSDDYRLEYRVGEKTSVYADGTYDTTDYAKGTPLYDDNMLRGTAGFSFKATEKTSLFGEFYYGQEATDPNRPFNTNDSTSIKGPHAEFYGGFVGARGDFTSRLKGSIKAGYESRQFSNDKPAADSPVVEATLDQRFSDRTTVSLIYSRRNSLSVQVAGDGYTADAISAQLRQVLTSDGKLFAIAGAGFENDDYKALGAAAARRDRVYRANFTLSYSIQLWLSARLGYQFEKYDSNVVIDYNVNSVTLSILVGY